MTKLRDCTDHPILKQNLLKSLYSAFYCKVISFTLSPQAWRFAPRESGLDYHRPCGSTSVWLLRPCRRPYKPRPARGRRPRFENGFLPCQKRTTFYHLRCHLERSAAVGTAFTVPAEALKIKLVALRLQRQGRFISVSLFAT